MEKAFGFIIAFLNLTHTGKTFVQIEPLEFIERISRFIPFPRQHLRHYHGVFAPNFPLRKKVAASAQKRPEFNIQKNLQESSKKVIKVSFALSKTHRSCL